MELKRIHKFYWYIRTPEDRRVVVNQDNPSKYKLVTGVGATRFSSADEACNAMMDLDANDGDYLHIDRGVEVLGQWIESKTGGTIDETEV